MIFSQACSLRMRLCLCSGHFLSVGLPWVSRFRNVISQSALLHSPHVRPICGGVGAGFFILLWLLLSFER